MMVIVLTYQRDIRGIFSSFEEATTAANFLRKEQPEIFYEHRFKMTPYEVGEIRIPPEERKK